MLRVLAVAAASALLATAAAQTASPAARPSAPPASSPARSAPSGSNARAIEKAKSLGKHGIEKVAPKLGRAEKVVRKAEPAVEKALDQAIDFAAEKAGLAK